MPLALKFSHAMGDSKYKKISEINSWGGQYRLIESLVSNLDVFKKSFSNTITVKPGWIQIRTDFVRSTVTGDWGVVSSSLSHCAVSLSKTLYLQLNTASTQEDQSQHGWNIVDWHNQNQLILSGKLKKLSADDKSSLGGNRFNVD